MSAFFNYIVFINIFFPLDVSTLIPVLPYVLAHGNWEGVHCREKSRYPASCPDGITEDLCRVNASCLLWERGKFKRNVDNETRSFAPCEATDAPGVVDRGQWIPESSCYKGWLTARDIIGRLKKKKIVFVGDSMVRQAFHRLIWYIRGLRDVIEHYYHRDAIYQAAGFEDEFIFGSSRHSPTIDIQYVWAPSSIPLQRILDLKAHAVIIGLMYWRQNDTLSADLIHLDAIHKVTKLFWLGTPAQDPSKRKGDAYFAERNSNLRNWVSKRPGSSFVALDIIAANSVFRRNAGDGIHFQCATVLYHKPADYSSIKSPDNGDCQDLFNLNVVQLIMNSL
jgi:hypothetical protein